MPRTVERPSVVKADFKWKTKEGPVLELCQMDTKHLFNSMKMMFNHLAAVHGGMPVWFVNQWDDWFVRAKRDPNGVAKRVCQLMAEIEERGDLPTKYHASYNAIRIQVCGEPYSLWLESPDTTVSSRYRRPEPTYEEAMEEIMAEADFDDFEEYNGW